MQARAVVVVACSVVGAGRAVAAPPELGACALAVAPGAAAPQLLAQLPGETSAGAGVRSRFRLLDARARGAMEVAIAAWAPAWKPEVHVDATGMLTELALTLPGQRAAADALPDVLAFVRAHACLFGVSDPAAITAHVYLTDTIFIDRAPSAIGAISVLVTPGAGGTTVRFGGHFWPIADAEVPITPRRVLARYLGRKITQDWEDLSSVGFGNHRTLHRSAGETDFRAEGGRALFCRRGVLDVHEVAYVQLLGNPDGPDRRLAELPTVVDAADGEPFGAAWIMPTRIEPTDNGALPDRMNAAGAACLGVPPP